MTTSNYPEVTIYTDGACSGNPGEGGLGAILIFKDIEKPVTGYLPLTTNNQMELIAAILALETLSKKCVVNLYTDSVYVKNGISVWIKTWKKNNWKNSANKPVKNISLWKILDEAQEKHIINWYFVKGHNGDLYNEKVDSLARGAIKAKAPLLERFINIIKEG